MSEIFNKIDQTVGKYHMLSEGDTVVIGVSGGKDSMLLLNYFLYKKEAQNLHLIVANVEHGIRGQASLDDTAFVQNFCEEKKIEFQCLHLHAPEEAKAAGKGIEEYSRERRYAFFQSLHADKIATAHSLSDNVETALFRLSRGTGLNGMKGIPPVRGNIIRPLIECTSEEIMNACRTLSVPFVTDETNSDNAYARNFIRNEIVPRFKQLNPSFEKAVFRFIENAAEAHQFLESEAERYLNGDVLDVKQLNTLPASVSKRAIIAYAKNKGMALDDLHVNKVYRLLFKPGKYQLKENTFAVSNKDALRIFTVEDRCNGEVPAVLTQRIPIDEFLNNCELYNNMFAFSCDCDKISGNVNIRTRLPQDRISPAGRHCSKSLKKLYNELQIPIEERDGVFVITDDKGVIGIYGYCTDESVKIDKQTQTVYLLNINGGQ